MENKITPQQALLNIYQVARTARLTAEEHNIIATCYKIVDEALNPKKTDDNANGNN